MIAVCVSGITGPEYEKVLELQRKVFPYDFFFQQWEGYPEPNVSNCLYTPEPKWDYHVMEDVKVKPDCDIFRRYTKKPDGKMYRKKKLYTQLKHSANQQIAHAHLVESLPEKYKTIIRLRFDTLVSTKVDFAPYVKLAEEGWVIGFHGGREKGDNPGPIHKFEEQPQNLEPWRIWDHIQFHPRDRLKNVLEMKEKQELNGSEWGWYQIYAYQSSNMKYKNVFGGESIVKWTKQPLQWNTF
jgi:hypothetical protein